MIAATQNPMRMRRIILSNPLDEFLFEPCTKRRVMKKLNAKARPA